MRTTIAASLAALAVCLAPAHAQSDQKLKVGSEPPQGMAEHVEFVQGNPVAAFSKDKVYVVEFWATWCPPCKKSIPHLTELQRDLGPRGLEIIGVSDEPVDTVRRFVQEKGSSMGYTVATQRKDDTFMSERWMKAAGQNGIPCAFVIARSGKIVHIGNPLSDDFDRVIRMTLANRYDPELTKRVSDTIAAARAAAKRRNFKEASGLYEKAIAEGPSTLLEYGFENWRMINEQANDADHAKAYVRSLVDQLGSDKYALIEAVNYLATDTSIQKRDLESAQYAADRLAASSKGSEDPDVLAAVAAVRAARGDYAGAAEMQYDAWMAAPPAAKPAFKKALDIYEGKGKAGS